MKYDVIIIGGGAAGLFCAIEAGKRGRKTLVIEHNAQIGRKIIISGGGRCNFTNTGTKPENFISANPHFCKSALARYTPEDFVELVRKHRIEFYEKKLGQLFCRESSRQIVEMLQKECEAAKVDFELDCSVKQVDKSTDFAIQTTRGKFTSESLVVATGGLSYPKVGASNFGYTVAKQYSVRCTSIRPSLVALVMAGGEGYANLAGLSLEAVLSTGKQSFRENILFTHRGLSGPAVLQISNYWQKRETVSINLLPETNALEHLTANRYRSHTIENFLGSLLPQRFAETFVMRNFPNKPLNQLSTREIEGAAEVLNNWQVEFGVTEGYDRAEVTIGGISTEELSSQTMEVKKVAGLYFVGELVDVTGWLGGYNFQWAWASGFAAGQNV